MKIACIGGGPAGLYFAISMKLRDPRHEIEVFERNAPGVTFGWGVVFSDLTVDNITRNDPVSAETITARVRALGRYRRPLQRRDDHLGRARLHRHRPQAHARDPAGPRARAWGRAALRCRMRSRRPEMARLRPGHRCPTAPTRVSATPRPEAFGIDIDVRAQQVRVARHAKCSTPSPSRSRRPSTAGSGRTPTASRPIARPSSSNVRRRPGAASASTGCRRTRASPACEKLFAKYLDGHSLQSNATHLVGSAAWLNFRRIKCERWSSGNVILLGDAAHTAHFSIGSGTKLALEDAIKLAEVLNRPGLSLEAAIDEYQSPSATSKCSSSRTARATRPNGSRRWSATPHFEPLQFAYSLLTRVAADQPREPPPARPRMAGRRRALVLETRDRRTSRTRPRRRCSRRSSCARWRSQNRITVSPMAMYSAVDGVPNDFHFVHYGERAIGGAGLVFTEMTCVSPEGRISPGCTGMWNADHVAAWKRIVDFVHAQLESEDLPPARPFGRQGFDPHRLGRQRRAARRRQLAGDGGERRSLVAGQPGAAPMTRADMDRVRDQFVAAVRMGLEAGFDMVELHAAHGYLLSSFITPLQNKRTDEYGGSLENRLRYPLEVFAAMRAAWPSDRPMSVRISATDWAGEDGITPDEAVLIGEAFAARRRGPDRRLGGPDLGRPAAGLRPHVPDPVQRPHPQRGQACDHGGRQHLRARSRQFDPRRRPRRPRRAGAPAPGRPVLDAARRRPARLPRRRRPAAISQRHGPARQKPEARRRSSGAR